MTWWKRFFGGPKRRPDESLQECARSIVSLAMNSANRVLQKVREHAGLEDEQGVDRSDILFCICASVLIVESQRLLWEGLVESQTDALKIEKLIYDAFQSSVVLQ